MSKTDWLSICDDIDDGAHDEGLDEIARAIQTRREVVIRRNARRLLRELELGDRVMLTNGIKPRYLEGMVGTVKQIKEGAAVIFLDSMPTAGRGRPAAEGMKQKLLVPLINLTKLDADVATLSDAGTDDIGDDEDYEDEDDDD